MESLEKTITARNLLFAELVANSDKISEISDSLDDFRDGIDKIIETNQQTFDIEQTVSLRKKLTDYKFFLSDNLSILINLTHDFTIPGKIGLGRAETVLEQIQRTIGEGIVLGRIRHVEPFDFGEMLRGLDKMTIEAKLQNLINFFNEIRKSVDELLTKINLLSKELDGVVLKKSDEVGEDVIQRYMTEVTAYTESEIDKR